jgi:hypothetical protein
MYNDVGINFLYGLTAGLVILFVLFFVIGSIPSKEKTKCELKLTREHNCVSVYVPENLVNSVNQIILENSQ